MTESVGIIGCGWLGLPLAKHLAEKDFSVNGTTTSKDKLELLKGAGISPYLVALSEDNIKGPIAEFLKDLSILIINVPPGLRGKGPKESYLKKMTLLHEEIKKSSIDKIIFVSSTSVYGDVEGTVTEETIPNPVTESGRQLLACEHLFTSNTKLKTSIIRFGGLIGPDRHPVTMLSGRENLKGGDAPVNLIHLNDCLTLIHSIIKHEQWNHVFNGVYPDHPTKKDYYTAAALKREITPPDYQISEGKKYKKIQSCKYFLIKNDIFLTSIYA